ncbi:MAG: ATP-binding cassette domain-containing protein [Flavobacteriales bacterium]|nr:ATP-binding cassette domain-containing protein [Flavobacteriales bacterium]MCB9178852.1 ATP-binding cassette domain-containing protein [Flavobacteriales bacterium]
MSLDPITPWQRLTRLLKVDKREIGHIYLYALVGGAISLSVPLGIQAIINLISGGQVATSWGVLIAFVTIGVGFTGVLQVMQLALAENIQQRLFARSAFEFAYRIPRIKAEAVGGKYLPELVNRFFDTMSIQKGLSKLLLEVPLALLQIALCLILLALYHPFFIAFGAFLLLLLYGIFRFSGKRGLETSITESGFKYAVAHWLEELARSMGTFKLIGETDLPLERTDQLVNGYVTARKAHFRVLLGQYGAMVVFKVIVTLSLLALGGVLVMNEQMNLGQFVAAEIVILLLMGAVEKIILRIETVYDVLTALDKVGSVTDLPLEREEGLRTLDREASKGLDVKLTGVAFRSHFHGRPVLEGIDLHLMPGEKVCLCGPNGVGKTTLLRILGGAITAHEGTVQLDGHPMNSLNLDIVRSVIGDSLTEEDVFAGTVMENIAVGRPWVTEGDVTEACRVTGLFEQLSQYPEGLLTKLDPQGSRLPKSLVKRIIQARCIAGSPRLILLEDSLQNWDVRDREELLGWISAPERPWTLLAVSNDPWLQQRCSRNLHLRDGKLIPA